MGKDIKVNEDTYFLFIDMVKKYLEDGNSENEKKLLLNYINYNMDLRSIIREKDLWFEFYKKNNSPEALEKYKELKEKHIQIKDIDIWRYDEQSKNKNS